MLHKMLWFHFLLLLLEITSTGENNRFASRLRLFLQETWRCAPVQHYIVMLRVLNLIFTVLLLFLFCSRDVIWDKERGLLPECSVLSPADNLDNTLLCNLFRANALQTCSFAVRNWDISSESNTDWIKIPPLSLINNHTHKHPGLFRDQKKKWFIQTHRFL